MEVKTSGKPIDQLLEKVLCMNILSSDYFKELYRLKTYHEVVDEIYNQVDHVEPWMTGNCRGPSTAFCLLYKFFTMKLTVKQMHGLLKHPDSPYIRAVGFLYLRIAGDPKTLWSWFEPYVKDDESTLSWERLCSTTFARKPSFPPCHVYELGNVHILSSL
ncbi:pre-mRNA splicing factor SR-like 1 isoform X4 [Rhododendron vialii]|uniref:pre-mRNA splicing factor SR-like 1 isoform X4 n=1 Tax=Rhododendron vialii TaxID=182163 RepID=UPI00265E7672|nr:pre-mRNA splicing factor SR-like 1 isoform X4 [Rhododendron vialii]